VQRLGEFWVGRSRLGKTLLAVGTAAVVVVIVGAVLRASDEETNGASETDVITTEATEASTAGDPIGCVDAAGLSGVEERDSGLWSGFHDGPSYAIVIHRLARPAKAPTVVAGTYALTGSFKVGAEGSGLTVYEGLLADALVQDVATCLGG
jgi:hypothetical protein